MLQAERYQKIEALLADHDFMSIADLTAALSTSRATVYRDIRDLANLGRIQLVRGGASLVSYPILIKNDEPYSEKIRLNSNEKKRIAHYAASLVEPGMTIVMDSSTTIVEMCGDLLHIPGLHVITNDLRIASELRSGEGLSVYVTGGFVRHNFYTLSNTMPDNILPQFSADITFIACDAFTPDRGCMITNSDEVSIKREMLALSSRHILLCDHSKFDKTAFCSFAGENEIDTVIVGQELSEEKRKKHTGSSYEMVYV